MKSETSFDNLLSVKKSIEINADPMRVWETIVNPDLVKEYFFGTNVKSDWQVGQPIIFSGSYDGKQYEDKGTILEIRAGSFLKYSYWSSFSGLEDSPENYSIVSYCLEKRGVITFLTIQQQGFTGIDKKQHADQGWAMILEGLKSVAERNG